MVSMITGRRVMASKKAKRMIPVPERYFSLGDSSFKRTMATMNATAMANASRQRKTTKSL